MTDDEEDEYSDDEGEGTFDCPKCGASIFYDAPKCAQCGDYVTPGAAPERAAWPWWIWLGLALAAALLLGWLMNR